MNRALPRPFTRTVNNDRDVLDAGRAALHNIHVDMDGAGPGEAGVLAWCNSIRLTMARDAGREVLDVQIQKQGFDFLESYLDNVFSRAKEE